MLSSAPAIADLPPPTVCDYCTSLSIVCHVVSNDTAVDLNPVQGPVAVMKELVVELNTCEEELVVQIELVRLTG